MVVKHVHVPKETVKFLGEPQSKYEKKNWSSVMLFNNARCRALSAEYVNAATGLELHQFKWLGDDSLIGELPPRWKDLAKLLDKKKSPLPASSLYAIATLDLGYPYINFTPSPGSAPAAIGELAVERDTCHMGHDGKTGETLLKSVLAPMFANRNLKVMSWVGHNIFGNLDGKVLDDPANKRTKVRSKDRLLHQILGYSPQTLVSIEYIESLGDWKTAWDHVHFRGFLGTPMALQFTWQGCDSLLAAPLVLDLVRFTELAHRRGEHGLLTFLASFFKSPLGVEEHDFGRQFQMLENWARQS